MASKNATRRLLRDLKDLTDSPLPGISIHPLDDDLFKLHANIKILEGPYKDIIVHIELRIPETYPQSSPSGKIATGFSFTPEHHHHVYTFGICNDYLSNFENSFSRQAGTGWTPSVTLKDLLMVLQPFLADPDFPRDHIITDNIIEQLRRDSKMYECSCGHTTKNPLPPLGEITNLVEKSELNNQVKDNLVCSVSKSSYFEDPYMILGYPLHLKRDSRNRLWTTLIPEMLCYEQYALAIQSSRSSYFSRENYRSATGKEYTDWLPIYINEEHFQRGLTHCKHCISVVSNGIEGFERNDFKPEMVLRVLPALLNKNIVAMMNGTIYESESAIYAYSHYLRLFIRLLDLYPKLREDIKKEIENFINGKRSKRDVPDIGEFIIKLSLSEYKYTDPKIQTPLLEEYTARQIFWIQKTLGKNQKYQLDKLFKAAEVSNKLLVFNIMAAKTFIFPGVTDRLDSNYGLPPIQVVNNFQNIIKQIKTINNYQVLLEAISYNHVIKTPQQMTDFINKAVILSKNQGYTS